MDIMPDRSDIHQFVAGRGDLAGSHGDVLSGGIA
jgi:hypothetical protein